MSNRDGRALLVMCAGTAWDGVPGSDRWLATELLRHADILWVDPEISLATRGVHRHGAARSLVPALDRPAAGVTRLRPNALPLHSRHGIRRTTPALVRSQIRWALRRVGRTPHAVIDCRVGCLLGGWGPGVRNILYGTDDYVAGASLMGLNVSHVREREADTVAHADLVIAISPTLAARWAGMGAKVALVPNGVRTENYRTVDSVPPAAEVRLPAPIAGVIGQLSERIDIGLLEAVAASGMSLLLVGPVEPRWEPDRFAALIARPQVAWVGRQPFAALPEYLRLIDVGLTPYANTEFNRASFPLKTLEYLAAGRPVVSTDLPATRWLDTDLIKLASAPEEFVAAVRGAAVQPRSDEWLAARRSFAERHSWRARADEVADLLGL